MGEKSNQIERRIAAERGQLGRNLNELQKRVEQATDWRLQFQKRPLTILGAAFGGGLLFASLTGRRPRSRRRDMSDRGAFDGEHRQRTELQKNKALETFDAMKGAVIGVAANTFKDLLGQLIPGFHEEFEKTVREKGTAGMSARDPRTLSASAR